MKLEEVEHYKPILEVHSFSLQINTKCMSIYYISSHDGMRYLVDMAKTSNC